MEPQRIEVPGIYVNLSPDAFHMWATHYYKCRQDFKPPHKFSPVPYFLLCRAIELELKARHLQKMGQLEVKDAFSHDMLLSYSALNQDEKILTNDEFAGLERANEIYKSKGFEYFVPSHALTGYSIYPDLDLLDTIARKLIGNDSVLTSEISEP